MTGKDDPGLQEPGLGLVRALAVEPGLGHVLGRIG